jgi:tetratricopeptide (TPR) repeat protein
VSANNQIDISNQYNKVLKTIAARAVDETEDIATQDAQSLAWLENQYSMLQNELTGIPLYGDIDEDGEVITYEIPEEESDELSEEAIDYLASALRHGEQINQLSGQNSTRFDELVHLGELELAKGNYFDAQRRFNQSLQFIPGHPLATAGLGHAKIGAGLYLSAGYVLQSLLSFQPEMIDVKYGEGLLPPRIELVRAAVTVQNRLDAERDAGTYAFLLAYLGHQLHDQEMVENGLDVLEMYSGSDDPITPLLRKIWLEQAFMPESQDE